VSRPLRLARCYCSALWQWCSGDIIIWFVAGTTFSITLSLFALFLSVSVPLSVTLSFSGPLPLSLSLSLLSLSLFLCIYLSFSLLLSLAISCDRWTVGLLAVLYMVLVTTMGLLRPHQGIVDVAVGVPLLLISLGLFFGFFVSASKTISQVQR